MTYRALYPFTIAIAAGAASGRRSSPQPTPRLSPDRLAGRALPAPPTTAHAGPHDATHHDHAPPPPDPTTSTPTTTPSPTPPPTRRHHAPAPITPAPEPTPPPANPDPAPMSHPAPTPDPTPTPPPTTPTAPGTIAPAPDSTPDSAASADRPAPADPAPPTKAPVAPLGGSEAPAGRPESGPVAPFPLTRMPLSPAWVAGSGSGPTLELTFPVLGPVRYSGGWGAPRGDHGERRHEGTDILGVRGQPLRAAFDGTVTRYQLEDRGISGAAITITRADGLRANYFHVNTDDLVDGTEDAAPASWRIPTAVELGSTVSAGQIVGFMGDSGNAVGVPHLHFELRTPEGVPFDPFPALRSAEDNERCAPAFGPWANVGAIPDVPVAPVVEVRGPDGASWQLTARGEVVAFGRGADVGRCDPTDRPGR